MGCGLTMDVGRRFQARPSLRHLFDSLTANAAAGILFAWRSEWRYDQDVERRHVLTHLRVRAAPEVARLCMHGIERPFCRALRLSVPPVLLLVPAVLAPPLHADNAEPVDYQTSPKALSRSVSEIHALAAAPDRPLLATAHADGLVVLRSAETGEMLRVLTGHQGPVSALAFSPDGLRLVSGGYDGTVRIWNVERGEAEAVLTGHTSRVMAVTFADNRTIASGGYDKTVRLSDAEQAREIASLDQRETVFSLEVSSDGEHLAVGKSNGSMAIWNLPERKLRTAIPAHNGPVRDLAFTLDGRSLITGGEDDPVGGRSGQRRLAGAYARTGHTKVTRKLYPQGRHEMLNETNRDEFTRDVLRWIGDAMSAGERR